MSTARKGFTLIELLVVIAVLGILAAVVLVAINPSERIAEANDAGVKNNVGQVATAVEAYFTNNRGSYTGAALGASGSLVTLGYLKRDPGGVTLTINTGASAGTLAVVYGTLTAKSAGTCASTNYWVYRTATGASAIECLAAAPAP